MSCPYIVLYSTELRLAIIFIFFQNFIVVKIKINAIIVLLSLSGVLEAGKGGSLIIDASESVQVIGRSADGQSTSRLSAQANDGSTDWRQGSDSQWFVCFNR
jgi:hypothetical protein